MAENIYNIPILPRIKCGKIFHQHVVIVFLLIILFSSGIVTSAYAVPTKQKHVIYPVVTEVRGLHSIHVFQICPAKEYPLKDDLVLIASDSSVVAMKINKQIDQCNEFSVSLITINPSSITTEIIEKENIEKRKTMMEKKISSLESIIYRLVDEDKDDYDDEDLNSTDEIPTRANALLEYQKRIIAKVNAIESFAD